MQGLTTQSAGLRGSSPVLEAGDIAPGFNLIDQEGGQIDLTGDSWAGKPTVLLFCTDPNGAATRDALARYQQAQDRLLGLGGQIWAILGGSGEQAASLADQAGLSYPVLGDLAMEVFGRYGLVEASEPVAVVLRANHHVMGVVAGASDQAVDQVIALLAAEAELRATRTMAYHPPILLLPDVLSRADCQRLISIFVMEGNVWVEPGHGDKGMTSDYKMRIPEYGRRDRVDHWVISTKTRDFISGRLQARLFPEIEKAFHYKITRAETYRIGCYEGERGGELHGHRDNSSPMGAHRRFACSINLNSEDFEGGALRFPEFGDQRYRPDTGVAFTFSSSLLHEPLPVTAGRRYVLLAFLFGER